MFTQHQHDTFQFQIIVPRLLFGFFADPTPLPLLFGTLPPAPPPRLINFPDFVLQIFQKLLKRIVVFAKLSPPHHGLLIFQILFCRYFRNC